MTMAKKSANRPPPPKPQGRREAHSARQEDARRASSAWPTASSSPPRSGAIRISTSRPARCRTSTTTSASGSSRWATRTNRRQLFNLSQAKSLHADDARGQRLQDADRPGQDDQHPRSVLPAQAHDRRHEGKDLRRPGRVRPDHRRRRSDCSTACARSCTSTPRTAATWSGRSRSSTAATRSIARGWAPAATAFPRSSSRR